MREKQIIFTSKKFMFHFPHNYYKQFASYVQILKVISISAKYIVLLDMGRGRLKNTIPNPDPIKRKIYSI